MGTVAEKTKPQVLTASSFDDTLQKPLTCGTFYKDIRDLRKDPTIALARMLVTAPVLASQWSIESEENAPEGAQDFIAEVMQPFRTHILRTGYYGCLDFGWQPYEKVFEIDSQGRFILKKLKPLLQDITDILIDPANGALVGIKQDELKMPIEECLVFYFNVEGTNWYGESTLWNAKATQDKWNKVDTAATRYDTKIAGSHWVIHYPIGSSLVDGVETDNFTVAKNILAQLEASGSIVVPRKITDIVDDLNKDAPDAWVIELKGDEGKGATPFVERMKYLDALKVRSLGLPERAVLEGQFGTKAEAEAHADFAITNIELNHLMLVQLVNWHLVNQLLVMNYGASAVNTVYIQPTPLTDLALSYLKTVYDRVLADPTGFMNELATMDLEALKDKLGIPVHKDLDISDVGTSGTQPSVAASLLRLMIQQV